MPHTISTYSPQYNPSNRTTSSRAFLYAAAPMRYMGHVLNDRLCVRVQPGDETVVVSHRDKYYAFTPLPGQEVIKTTMENVTVGHWYPCPGYDTGLVVHSTDQDETICYCVPLDEQRTLEDQLKTPGADVVTVPKASLATLTTWASEVPCPFAASSESTEASTARARTPHTRIARPTAPPPFISISTPPADAITGVAIGSDLRMVVQKLSELGRQVLAVVTHEPLANTTYRTVSTLKDLVRPDNFYRQGTLELPRRDTPPQGLSCGVEAARNIGFQVNGLDFVKHKTHPDAPDYVGCDNAANNIQVNCMQKTLQDAIDHGAWGQTGPGVQPCDQHIPSWKVMHGVQPMHHHYTEQTFWHKRTWALILIELHSNSRHWVGIEHVIGHQGDAWILREGRGSLLHDLDNTKIYSLSPSPAARSNST